MAWRAERCRYDSFERTALTRAIGSCNYDEAIKIMKSHNPGAIVNVGLNGCKPLQMVLLTKNYENPHNIVHLQLAKMLVVAGASPNLGTLCNLPSLYKDTPFELLLSLIDFLEEVLHYEGRGATVEEYFQCFGLQGEPLVSAHQVLEQAVELLHMFLDFGADPNLVTLRSLSTIFHIYLLQRHARVNTILKFHAAGADLNKNNVDGITPLMVLIMTISNKSVITVLEQMWPPHYEMTNLNLKNTMGWTALCYAMYAGSMDVAILLVQRNADVRACKVDVYQHSCVVRKFSISPLLFPLLCSSKPYLDFMYGEEKNKEIKIKFLKKGFSHEIFEKIMSLIIGPVIDAVVRDDRSVDEVGSDLLALIPDRWKTDTDLSVRDVMCLVAGKMTTNLQQLCVRQIVVEFIKARKSGDTASCVDPSLEASNIATLENPVAEIVANLHPHAVTKIVTEELSLPSFMVGKFFLEFARLEMGTVLYKYKTHSDYVFNEDSEEETTSSGNFVDSPSSTRSSSSVSSGSCPSNVLYSSESYSSSSDSDDTSPLENVENSGSGASPLENADFFQIDSLLLENVDISEGGTLTLNNVECSQIGESSSEKVDVYQVAPLSSEYVKINGAVSLEHVDISQGGAVSLEHVDISQGGAVSLEHVDISQGGAVSLEHVDISQGGAVSLEHVDISQGGAVSLEHVDISQGGAVSLEHVDISQGGAVSLEHVDISQGGTVSSANVGIFQGGALSSDNLENPEANTLASKNIENSQGETLPLEHVQNVQVDNASAGEGGQISQLDSRSVGTVDTVLPSTSGSVQEQNDEGGSDEDSPAQSNSQCEPSPDVCRKKYNTLDECFSDEDADTENI